MQFKTQTGIYMMFVANNYSDSGIPFDIVPK